MSKKRVNKIPKPKAVEVKKIPAWLSRCATMGYEIWGDKPELRENRYEPGYRQLLGWPSINQDGCFYFRLPAVDGKAEGTNIYLHEDTVQRIWLTVDISMRMRRTQDEVREDELAKAELG